MASKPTRDYWRTVIVNLFEDRLEPPQMDELREVLDQWEAAILDAAILRDVIKLVQLRGNIEDKP